jgi:drug/metabolite transporter (DMT)-like permease
MLPLCVSMCLNVILPNLSLAFSSVTFYQLARILLTPAVALMNFVLYRATLPRKAVLTLIPVCLGVGTVSYYDSLPAEDVNVKTTSPLGVFFAFTGVFASSLYTVWVGSYHRTLEMNSMQLLYNQAPMSSFMLLYIIPFVDTLPDWTAVPANRWLLILLVSFATYRRWWFRWVPADIQHIVWVVCCCDQHLAVFHYCANGSGVEYRRRSSEDLFYCCLGMACVRSGDWR